jgi:hypothetical protein
VRASSTLSWPSARSCGSAGGHTADGVRCGENGGTGRWGARGVGGGAAGFELGQSGVENSGGSGRAGVRPGRASARSRAALAVEPWLCPAAGRCLRLLVACAWVVATGPHPPPAPPAWRAPAAAPSHLDGAAQYVGREEAQAELAVAAEVEEVHRVPHLGEGVWARACGGSRCVGGCGRGRLPLPPLPPQPPRPTCSGGTTRLSIRKSCFRPWPTKTQPTSSRYLCGSNTNAKQGRRGQASWLGACRAPGAMSEGAVGLVPRACAAAERPQGDASAGQGRRRT